MVASLTGFGRAEHTDTRGRVCAEFKSVNNRFLQLDLHLPYGYSWIDSYIRALVSEKVFRGKVLCHLEVIDYSPTQNIVINRPLIGKLLALQTDLEKELGRSVPTSLDGLLALPGVVKTESSDSDNDVNWERIKPIAQKALNSFLEFRRREGEKLSEDLIARQKRLTGYVKTIEERIPEFKEKFIERFTARITELAGKTDLEPARLGTEIALWTDRSDISEELTRLKCHLEELAKILQAAGPVGRKLDFLLQEINREANTIGNKIGDLIAIQQVLEIKCEVEKIREQAQNLE